MRLLATDAYGLHHMAAGGQCSLVRLRGGDLRRSRASTAACCRPPPPSSAGPAPRPGLLGARAPQWRGRDLPARLAATGLRGYLGSADEAARDRRGRASSARPTRGWWPSEHDVVVLDKLTYAGRRENLEGVGVELVEGAIEDPASCARRWQGADAVVNFAAESHVDRSIAGQDPFAHDARDRHRRAARRRARAGRRALPPGVDRRGVRLDRLRLVHRDLAAEPVVARTARPRPAATCWCPPTCTRTGSRP